MTERKAQRKIRALADRYADQLTVAFVLLAEGAQRLETVKFGEGVPITEIHLTPDGTGGYHVRTNYPLCRVALEENEAEEL